MVAPVKILLQVLADPAGFIVLLCRPGHADTLFLIQPLNADDIKRHIDVVGTFAKEPGIRRPVGALLLGQTDQRQLQPRYIQLEGVQAARRKSTCLASSP